MQAFVIAGGGEMSSVFSSVITLLPGATAWTPLASLPRALMFAQASIVRGKIRINGGLGAPGSSGASGYTEVSQYDDSLSSLLLI